MSYDVILSDTSYGHGSRPWSPVVHTKIADAWMIWMGVYHRENGFTSDHILPYVCTYTYAHILIYTNVYIYICIYIPTSYNIYKKMHTHIYIYIHIHT